MPITKSAKKALRQQKRKTLINNKIVLAYKKAIKTFRKKPTKALLSQTFSALDQAAKKNVIRKGKADRLKARLSRLVKETTKTVSVKTKKSPRIKKI